MNSTLHSAPVVSQFDGRASFMHEISSRHYLSRSNTTRKRHKPSKNHTTNSFSGVASFLQSLLAGHPLFLSNVGLKVWKQIK
jgi:uncharacterized protein (DUF427 family)